MVSTLVGLTMVLLALALPRKPPSEKLTELEPIDKYNQDLLNIIKKENTKAEAILSTSPEKEKVESETKNRVSNRLVDLIDIVFGVVVAVNFAMLLGSTPFESLPTAEQMITLPNLSILVAYVAIILSWVGYHQMIEHNPYILNRWGYIRFSIDVIIVFMYTVVMYSINVTPLYLGSFVIVFLLYAIGGLVRDKEYEEKVSWSRGSLKFTGLFFVVLTAWFVWGILSTNYPELNLLTMWISAILVVVVLALNLRYRYERARKGFKRKSEAL